MVKSVHASVAFLVAIGLFFVFPSESYSNEKIKFEEIMALMKGADITYERFNYYERPFKVFSKDGVWILEQQETYDSSPIKSAGDNKISVNDFPHNWTINGTWKFSKDGNRCKIDHLRGPIQDGGMEMRWECN